LAAIAGALALADQLAGSWQERELERRRELKARLDKLSFEGLRTGIDEMVYDGEHYRMRLRLQNAAREPFFILLPSLEGFVQVGPEWKPFPIHPDGGEIKEGMVIELIKERAFDEAAAIEGAGYAEPIEGYRHLKITLDALVSPEQDPQEEIGEHHEEYFLFLRDVTRDAEFTGQQSRRPSFIPLRAWTLLPKEAL
jgi:putative ABC transport system ATP-binding protein/macrolide transport system ATP-binding/permease protein/lipoprotein-releasing system ATP-binding protein